MRSAIDKHGMSRHFQRSKYVSVFAHMGEVYVYHGLYGYILKMSPDILDFLLEFGERTSADEVCQKYATAFGDEMTPEGLVGTFIQFGCLLSPNYDDRRDIWDMVPVRGRWTVWSRGDDGLITIFAGWGEAEVQKFPLTETETSLWDRVDGETTLEELAAQYGKDAVSDFVVKTVAAEVQAIKLSALPLKYYKNRQHMRPPYLTSTMPYPAYTPGETALPRPPEAYFSPDGYYASEVEDADAQFDHQETTLSHLFRKPHPALKGRTYGQAVTDALAERWTLEPGPIKVLEIGGGLGWVARAVTEALTAKGFEVTYHIQELSPALAASQRKNTAGLNVSVFEGDALTADLPGDDYDLVISNEMVGDLTAIKMTHEQLGMGEGEIDDATFEAGLDAAGWGGALVKKHTLPIGDAPDPFYLNVGAFRLIERIWDVLKPGGHAYITEFGEMARYPILSTHLDHPELSTHFGHCMLVARSVGFEADFAFIMDLIDMNRDMKGLATTRSYFKALQVMMAERGITLEKVGYTKRMFEALLGEDIRPNKDVGTIEFDRIEDRLMGLVPHEFKALLLDKPLPA